jgi:hypothetical protein
MKPQLAGYIAREVSDMAKDDDKQARPVQLRPNGGDNYDYLMTGKAGSFGRNSKTAEADIDAIRRNESATTQDAVKIWGIANSDLESVGPIVITTPTDMVNCRIGKEDNVFRSFKYTTVIIGFTKHQVMLLRKIWNVYDYQTEYTAKEMFYTDISSVDLIHREEKYVDGNNNYYKVVFHMSGDSFDTGAIPEDQYVSSGMLQALALIRDKKSKLQF